MKKFKVSIYQLTAIAIVLMALSLFAYDSIAKPPAMPVRIKMVLP